MFYMHLFFSLISQLDELGERKVISASESETRTGGIIGGAWIEF